MGKRFSVKILKKLPSWNRLNEVFESNWYNKYTILQTPSKQFIYIQNQNNNMK
jgi:hypothetical protein